MIFDVMIREKIKNEAGKQIIIVYRIRDTVLSKCLREAQDEGRYIISVIPLFRKREVVKEEMKKEDFAQVDFDGF